MKKDNKEFILIREAATRLKVSITTVHKYIRDGLLDAYQVGGRGPWRIRAESFREFEKEYM